MDAPPGAQIVAKKNFPNETVATGRKTHGQLPALKCLAACSGGETAVHENILWSAAWAKTGACVTTMMVRSSRVAEI